MTVCQPWDLDTECCDLPEDVDPDLLAHWQAVSSEILWAASGRRYGLCEVTIRPCVRRCGGGSGLPVPYKGSDGAWRNYSACGCNDDCSCTALSEIVLPGPVASVVQVLIDGTELQADNYRLDTVGGQWRLVRTDGGTWPDCSDMTAACDEDGAFCVTFEQGIPLSELAIAANSEATCELTKACIPGCKTCRLPKNTQAVVRRGVSISMETGLEWIKGLPMVAAFLEAVNPKGLTSKSSVWSPDVKQPRTMVTSSES